MEQANEWFKLDVFDATALTVFVSGYFCEGKCHFKFSKVFQEGFWLEVFFMKAFQTGKYYAKTGRAKTYFQLSGTGRNFVRTSKPLTRLICETSAFFIQKNTETVEINSKLQ